MLKNYIELYGAMIEQAIIDYQSEVNKYDELLELKTHLEFELSFAKARRRRLRLMGFPEDVIKAAKKKVYKISWRLTDLRERIDSFESAKRYLFDKEGVEDLIDFLGLDVEISYIRSQAQKMNILRGYRRSDHRKLAIV